MSPSLRLPLTFLLLAACSRSTPPQPSTESAASASQGATSSTRATDQTRADQQRVAKVVRAWSDALDRHDLGALEPLYAAHVAFYGRPAPLPRAEVMQLKRAALKDGTFRQDIVGDLEFRALREGVWEVRFQKRSGRAGKLSQVRAWLALGENDAGHLVIVRETDDASEHADAGGADAACATAADQVVFSLPQVKQAWSGALKAAAASGGGARAGSVGSCEPKDDPCVMEYGVHTDERFERYLGYEVDRHTGQLTVDVMATDVQVPKPGLKKVAEACKR